MSIQSLSKYKYKSSKVLVGLIKRPLGESVEIDHAISEWILETSCRWLVVAVGDFNLPVTRWGDPFYSHTGRDLHTNLLESDLHQHVNKPMQDSSILDLIFQRQKNLSTM